MSKQKRKSRPVQARKYLRALNPEDVHSLCMIADKLGIDVNQALKYAVNIALSTILLHERNMRKQDERSEEVRPEETASGPVADTSFVGDSESDGVRE